MSAAVAFVRSCRTLAQTDLGASKAAAAAVYASHCTRATFRARRRKTRVDVNLASPLPFFLKRFKGFPKRTRAVSTSRCRPPISSYPRCAKQDVLRTPIALDRAEQLRTRPGRHFEAALSHFDLRRGKRCLRRANANRATSQPE